MIRRANHDSVKVVGLLLEHLAVVLVALGTLPVLGQLGIPFLLQVGNGVRDVIPAIGVHIAVGGANVAVSGSVSNVALVDAADTDESDTKLIALVLSVQDSRCPENARPSSRTGGDEFTSGDTGGLGFRSHKSLFRGSVMYAIRSLGGNCRSMVSHCE